LAQFSFFTVIDSYPIELLFPIRQGRSPQRVARKVKIKDAGVWETMLGAQPARTGGGLGLGHAQHNTHDQHFHLLIERYKGLTIVLSDSGFRSQNGILANLKLCQKGTWNERICVETALSMVTVVCNLKRLRHRLASYIQARLA
jgi:hypothetical protein